MSIKNVIICGLGALGITYAVKLKDVCNLKILADTSRINKYKKNTPIFNNELIDLNYITPQDSFDADLIIIATKSTGLNSAIEYIKNFITPNTIIISLLNGISSEDKIKKTYPNSKVFRSFFIGHSAIGEINEDSVRQYSQDGVGKIVFEPTEELENFFSKNNINFEVSNNIIQSQWIKLGVNVILNQLSAINKCTVGELRAKNGYPDLAKNLLIEVDNIAKAQNIEIENFTEKVLEATALVADDGLTSMYQDVISKKKTEVDIFSGEIIQLGKIYGIKTPYNEEIYSKIKLLERDFS